LHEHQGDDKGSSFRTPTASLAGNKKAAGN